MEKIKCTFKLVANNLKKWNSPRIYVLLVYLLMFYDTYMKSIREFVTETEVKATPFLYPFLLASGNFIVFYMIGALFLFSNAPFLSSDQNYIVIRTGKKKWLSGQILYIFISSILYTFGSVIFSIVLLGNKIELRNEWGKVYNTFAQTNASEYTRISFPYKIIVEYQPMQALLLVAFISVLITFMLGMIQFFSGLYLSKSVGILCGTILILFHATFEHFSGFWGYFISPISWVNLTMVNKLRTNRRPTFFYVFAFLIIINAALVIISFIKVRKIEFRDSEE